MHIKLFCAVHTPEQMCLSTCAHARHVPINLSTLMPTHMSIHMPIHMSVHMSVHISVHMSVPMSVHMSVHMCAHRFARIAKNKSGVKPATEVYPGFYVGGNPRI